MDNNHWFKDHWRPAMGWTYMSVCIFDFILAPILFATLQAFFLLHDGQNVTISQWKPLTLEGAGLFHIAMGAILGVAVYGRTQEKLNAMTSDTSREIKQ